MKIVTVVLLGLILWNVLLTGVLFAGYEIAVGQSFGLASLRADLGKTKFRLSKDENALVQINKQSAKTETLPYPTRRPTVRK